MGGRFFVHTLNRLLLCSRRFALFTGFIFLSFFLFSLVTLARSKNLSLLITDPNKLLQLDLKFTFFLFTLNKLMANSSLMANGKRLINTRIVAYKT
tara:strand:- start:243 stop:530 length:288 start_codon:yes stop_codon:yes gene_type:complete